MLVFVQRERERDRQTDIDRHRQRYTDIQRQRYRQTERERVGVKHWIKIESQIGREDKWTEMDAKIQKRQRDADRNKDTGSGKGIKSRKQNGMKERN